MYYVYILQSINNPSIVYKGYTKDLKQRIKKHNKGDCIFTNKYRPWKVVCYFAFFNKKFALDFEKYLKSGSGKAFLNRHFINRPS
jgi:predicted GIY-YIG superfamily endonuclease